jgi:phenylpropionate dioxygenase-like ring-hydroxylating dioxygenase large terminal subunit
MGADIPSTGDAFTLEAGGVPIVVVRAADGTPRAYVNVCRHRGATVVDGPACGLKHLTCPFHGWVYDVDDGGLVGQPRACDGFADLDPADLGLRELGVAEMYGIIVVRADGPDPIDVDQWLAGMAPDLRSLAYERLLPYRTERSTWNCNWKLLLETFLESYHVPTLHKRSLAAHYLGNASPFDAFGRHNRIVVPQTSILQLVDLPRDARKLLSHAVLQYYVAPNVIISNLYGYVMTYRFLPSAAGRTTVEHALYTYQPAESAEDREHFDQRFAAARTITGAEDFPQSEIIHRNLASGAVDATIAGRNEPGVVHLHRMLEAAVGP